MVRTEPSFIWNDGGAMARKSTNGKTPPEEQGRGMKSNRLAGTTRTSQSARATEKAEKGKPLKADRDSERSPKQENL